MSALSQTMHECLRYMLTRGHRLVVMPGGYWVAPGEVINDEGKPTFHFRRATLTALRDRGLVAATEVRIGRGGTCWATKYSLTAAGLATARLP